jgi:hypothetical protein
VESLECQVPAAGLLRPVTAAFLVLRARGFDSCLRILVIMQRFWCTHTMQRETGQGALAHEESLQVAD